MPFVSRFRLISNTLAFAELLTSRGYPSLDVAVQVIGGETHTSVAPAALTRGLRALLQQRPS
ncbi:MAG TPA: hypothetical protein VFI96_05635 [Longimicrobiaceae bacterium]|nr:hypothetical protein [Longimicrobiaceae bacterium]